MITYHPEKLVTEWQIKQDESGFSAEALCFCCKQVIERLTDQTLSRLLPRTRIVDEDLKLRGWKTDANEKDGIEHHFESALIYLSMLYEEPEAFNSPSTRHVIEAFLTRHGLEPKKEHANG